MPDKSQDAPHDAYFEDLLVRYLDNQLSPGGLAEFQAMLTADSARCEQLAQWAHQAMLIQESPQECLMEFMDDEPLVGRVSRPDRRRTGSDEPEDPSYQALARSRIHRPVRWALGLVAVTAVVALVVVLAGRRSGRPELPADQEGIARVTSESDSSWGNSMRPRLGEPLQPGRLDLITGVATVTFQSGAEVLLEGPAELELVDGNRGVLHVGRAVARVPKPAIGFRLDTPTTSIVDLGTEFGVSRGRFGGTTVQVYEGKLIVGRHGEAASRRELSAGEALEFSADARETVRPLAFRPDRFIREMPPDSARGKDKGVPYNVSRHETLHVVPAPGSVMVDADLQDWDLSGGFAVHCEPPYGDHYYVQGYMMYDAERLYIAARVGDPRPLCNSIFPESEQAVSDVCWKGGSVQVWLSTDRQWGWPVEAYFPTYSPRRNDPEQQLRDSSKKLVGLIMWYYRPDQRPYLHLAYGMDRHRQTMFSGRTGLQTRPGLNQSGTLDGTGDPSYDDSSRRGRSVNSQGWEGAFRETSDSRGYVMEYAVAWDLLSAAADPPRGGDELAGIWMVHWSDATGRIWKGHIIEGRSAGIPGHPHLHSQTWGRTIYHKTGNLTSQR